MLIVQYRLLKVMLVVRKVWFKKFVIILINSLYVNTNQFLSIKTCIITM